MNKPSKFFSSLWEMMEMEIDKAVAAEREACAKLCDEARAGRLAEQIRARGQA